LSDLKKSLQNLDTVWTTVPSTEKSNPVKKRYKFSIAAIAASSIMIAISVTAGAVSPDTTSVAPSHESSVNISAALFSPEMAAQEARELRASIAADKAAKKIEDARLEAERVAAAKAEAERVAAANTRNIYVGIAGGQAETDLCAGPVLFQPPGYTMVVEHDYCGGWERIGSIQQGMTVNLSGLISGSYTVGEVITIPLVNRLVDMNFVNTPVVYLQTCIPGTGRMVVLGLY
jgi:hypothetical protein